MGLAKGNCVNDLGNTCGEMEGRWLAHAWPCTAYRGDDGPRRQAPQARHLLLGFPLPLLQRRQVRALPGLCQLLRGLVRRPRRLVGRLRRQRSLFSALAWE